MWQRGFVPIHVVRHPKHAVCPHGTIAASRGFSPQMAQSRPPPPAAAPSSELEELVGAGTIVVVVVELVGAVVVVVVVELEERVVAGRRNAAVKLVAGVQVVRHRVAQFPLGPQMTLDSSAKASPSAFDDFHGHSVV